MYDEFNKLLDFFAQIFFRRPFVKGHKHIARGKQETIQKAKKAQREHLKEFLTLFPTKKSP